MVNQLMGNHGLGIAKLKSAYNLLILVLEIWDGKPTYKKIMGWESFGAVRFDLGPLVQGQTRIAKLKSAYNSFIIGPRGLQCETNLWKIMGWKSSDVV